MACVGIKACTLMVYNAKKAMAGKRKVSVFGAKLVLNCLK